MPLSENEQRQLEAIERALIADDPKFAATVRSSDLRSHTRRRVVRAVALFTLGLVLLLFTFSNVLFGIAGFALMFMGALLGVTSAKRLRVPEGPRTVAGAGGRHPGASRGARGPRAGWRERVEDRWKRRWEERD